MGLLRLRRRRDRFGPGICNDAMRSETLQFGTFVMLCVYIRYVYSDCDVDVTDLDPEIVMVLCVARHCNLVFVMLCVYVARHCNFLQAKFKMLH